MISRRARVPAAAPSLLLSKNSACGSLVLRVQQRCGASQSPFSRSYSSSGSGNPRWYAPAFRIAAGRTSSRSTSLSCSSSPLAVSTPRTRTNPTAYGPVPRSLTTSSRAQSQEAEAPQDDDGGPSARYSALVSKNILSDDPFQRHIISHLQTLHNKIKTYEQNPPPPPKRSSSNVAGAAAAAAGKAIGVDAVAKGAMPTFGGIFGRLFGRGGRGNEEEEEKAALKISENIPKGLYLYGDVGTGKSMLMDLFYETLPSNIKRKRRIHFHQFMIDVHKRSHYFKSMHHKPSGMVMSAASAAASLSKAISVGALGAAGNARETLSRASAAAASSGGAGEEIDPIEPVAREIANECEVLCFDEFQVTDIADAMILRRLLEHILAYGVVCVMTSNRHPKDLYKNGIQRSSFLPCIQLLQDQFQVIDLDSGTDYRRVPKALSKVYFSSRDEADQREFEKIWGAMTESENVTENRQLSIWGRKVTVPQSTNKVARFTFMQLCGSPKSAADYIEICKRFHTIFIEDVPRMGLHQRDLARRFITFIDSVYESKTKLIVSSEVPILQIFRADEKEDKPTEGAMRSLMDDLGLTMDDIGGNPIFTGEEELFAFARVMSRLSEMNTVQYAQSLRTVDEAPPEA